MPSPTGRIGERAGIIFRATMTTELVGVESAGALVVPPAVLGCGCWGGGGDNAAGMLPVVRGGVIAAARKRRACACSCS